MSDMAVYVRENWAALLALAAMISLFIWFMWREEGKRRIRLAENEKQILELDRSAFDQHEELRRLIVMNGRLIDDLVAEVQWYRAGNTTPYIKQEAAERTKDGGEGWEG